MLILPNWKCCLNSIIIIEIANHIIQIYEHHMAKNISGASAYLNFDH